MTRHTIAVIGAGAVGSVLANAARSVGHRIAAVVSNRSDSARRLARRVRARAWGTDVGIISPDVTFLIIAVPDTRLEALVQDLMIALPRTRKRRTIVHTSGLRSSDLLRPLRRRNNIVASMHPIRSFPARGKGIRSSDLRDEWFGIEGRKEDLRPVRSFVRSLGAKSVVVPKSKKTLYHIACTFASNYPLALLAAAEVLAKAAGLKGGILPLQRLTAGSVRNGFEQGALKALTGPVVRGDLGTLRIHREEMRRTAPQVLPLFDELVGFASREAEQSGRITPSQGRSLRNAITQKASARKER